MDRCCEKTKLRRRSSRLLPVLAIGLLFCPAYHRAAAESGDDLAKKMAEVAARPAFRSAQLGFCWIDLAADQSTAQGYEIDRALIPASTMKVVTTAAANEILGPDYHFVTELQLTGQLDEQGTLHGDVIVRGGGDPNLAAEDLDPSFSRWEKALREAGVKKVDGSVIGDASLYGSALTPDSWQWGDMGNYYGAGACGLTIHRNLFHAVFQSTGVGGPAALLRTSPKLPEIRFFNEMRVGAAGSGDQGYAYGDPYGGVVTFRGTVPAGNANFSIKAALPDPALFCATRLASWLSDHGIAVEKGGTTDRLLAAEGREIAARRTIDQQSSEPLSRLLVVTNHQSDNLKAECIHRAVGVKVKGEGTTLAASRAITAYWEGQGVDMSGSVLEDGCGLSRANAISPRQMAAILHVAAKGEHFASFRESLPVAGRSGTLRSVGKGSAAEGRVRAKSGTIGRVRNYAGYVDTRSGRTLAFAIFFTHHSSTSSAVSAEIVRIWSAMVDL